MLGTETKQSNFWVVLVILCWIGCSSITQIANKEVLNEGQSSIILGGHSVTMWTDFNMQNKAVAICSCQYYCCSSSLNLFFLNSRIFVVAHSWFYLRGLKLGIHTRGLLWSLDPVISLYS